MPRRFRKSWEQTVAACLEKDADKRPKQRRRGVGDMLSGAAGFGLRRQSDGAAAALGRAGMTAGVRSPQPPGGRDDRGRSFTFPAIRDDEAASQAR